MLEYYRVFSKARHAVEKTKFLLRKLEAGDRDFFRNYAMNFREASGNLTFFNHHVSSPPFMPEKIAAGGE